MSMESLNRRDARGPLFTRRRLLGLLGAGGAAAVAIDLVGPAVAAADTGHGRSLAAPTGRWAIGTTSRRLVDGVRSDPFTGGLRELMLQFWYPTRRQGGCRRASYVSPSVASHLDEGLGISDPGRFAQLRPHAWANAPVAPAAALRGLPLVLFSHGSGAYQQSATAVAEDLASHGYAVVAIGHTRDSVAVEFPGGRIVGMGDPAQAGWTEAEIADRLDEMRAGDIQATVDHLSRPGGAHPLRGHVDPDRIGAFGHSRGGSAVSLAMGLDRRVAAGIGIDSSFATGVADTGLDRPFMLVTENHLGPENGPHGSHWKAFRTHQRGWGRHLKLPEAGHWTFMDPAPLLRILGTAHHLSADQIEQFFGPPALRRRAVTITRTYVRAFFDRHLKEYPAPLLDQPSPRFPEVEFFWSSD